MRASNIPTPFGVALSLFNVSSRLSMLGSTVPFDSKYDGFRHAIFDALMDINRAVDELDKFHLYESENS